GLRLRGPLRAAVFSDTMRPRTTRPLPVLSRPLPSGLGAVGASGAAPLSSRCPEGSSGRLFGQREARPVVLQRCPGGARVGTHGERLSPHPSPRRARALPSGRPLAGSATSNADGPGAVPFGLAGRSEQK